jgi:hypothetical protein
MAVVDCCTSPKFFSTNPHYFHQNPALIINPVHKLFAKFSLQPRHQIGPIEGDFAVALSLYHGYDLLMQHGLLPFYNFIKGQLNMCFYGFLV